jgi:hypothetical protein
LNIRNHSANYSRQKPVFHHWNSGIHIIEGRNPVTLLPR